MKPFSYALKSWGFNVVSSFDVIKNGDPNSKLTTPPEKVTQKVEKTAKKFYKSFTSDQQKPSIFSMSLFLFSRREINKLGPEYFDYNYWKDQGWFENNTYYYYNPKTNIVGKALAQLLSQIIGLIM